MWSFRPDRGGSDTKDGFRGVSACNRSNLARARDSSALSRNRLAALAMRWSNASVLGWPMAHRSFAVISARRAVRGTVWPSWTTPGKVQLFAVPLTRTANAAVEGDFGVLISPERGPAFSGHVGWFRSRWAEDERRSCIPWGGILFRAGTERFSDGRSASNAW